MGNYLPRRTKWMDQVFAKKPKCKHSGNRWRTRRQLPGYRKIYCCKRWQHKQCNARNEVGLWYGNGSNEDYELLPKMETRHSIRP